MKKNVTTSLALEKCCGCTACMAICPKHCITMREDKKGFQYPRIEQSNCIECGACETACPALQPNEKRKPISVRGAQHNDDHVRLSSSSGGVFFALAEWVISQGGVVFGARFDEKWEVMHDYTETLEGVNAFMGSKYSQSRMGNCYQQVKNQVGGGRFVLFTGTGCQIAGLKKYLKKEYDNLITVDVVCHGVPSPLVWRNYLQYIRRQNADGDGKNSVWSSVSGDP